MNIKNNKKIILFGVISIIVVIIVGIGITFAFVKNKVKEQAKSEISLSSCANITLIDGESINLENTYPMSFNMGLKTKPYEFSVSSTCDGFFGFNLYLSPLTTSNLDISNIHYVIKRKDSDELLRNTVMSESMMVTLTDQEMTELRTGLNNNVNTVYKIFSDDLMYKSSEIYLLYLWVDESVDDTNMMSNTFTFEAGISAKAYDREDKNYLADEVVKLYNGVDGTNGIYKHDGVGTYALLEAGLESSYENSYRYSGASDDVHNYVCFGGTCDNSGTSENLYRIIGVFNGEVKLVKATEATSDLLGGFASDGITKLGAYSGSNNEYYWNNESEYNNTWSHSLLNQYNLNSGYIPRGSVTQDYGFLYTIGETWRNMIVDHTWKVGGNSFANLLSTTGIRNVYNNEIGSTNGEKEYINKVGLMYLTDYMYASDPTDESNPWKDLVGDSNDSIPHFYYVIDKNWLTSENYEWSISRDSSSLASSFVIKNTMYCQAVVSEYKIRPVFYLNSKVIKTGGTGLSTDPYIIEMGA